MQPPGAAMEFQILGPGKASSPRSPPSLEGLRSPPGDTLRAFADDDGLVSATPGAGLVVLGFSDRWQSEGLGSARGLVASSAQAPVLLVRGGARPGGLAPRESMTRYTWSLEQTI